MAGPSIDQLQEQLREMREHTLRMQNSSEHINASFGSIFKSLFFANLGARLIDHATEKVRHNIVSWGKALLTPAHILESEYKARFEEIGKLLAKHTITATESSTRALAVAREHGPLFSLRMASTKAYAEASRLALGYLGLSTTTLIKMGHESATLNDALIKANSSFDERNRLAAVNYDLTVLTGQGFGDVLQVQKALVNLGFALNKDYQSTVETVLLLHHGLGMSVETAAELAVVVTNQVKGSFERVSDVLTNIVNQTALAADEAARMTKELGMLLTLVRGQSAGALLPDMTKAVARYEDALKHLSGSSGAFTELIKRAAGPEGFGMAGMLGIQSPEMLTTQQGIDTLMTNFKHLGDSLVGESQGWQRRMGLDALGKMMGTSAEQVNLLYLSVKNVNGGVTDELSLRERYLEQTRDLGHSVAQLGARLVSLLQRGLYPFIQGLNLVFGALNYAADALARISWLPNVLSTLAFVAVPFALVALSALIKALYRTAVGAWAAKLGLDASSSGVGGILKSLLGAGAGGAGFLRTLAIALRSAFAVVTSPLFLIAGILAGTLLVLKNINDIHKETADKRREADWRHTTGLMDVAAQQRERIMFNARYGAFDGMDNKIKSYFSSLGGAYAKEGLSNDEITSRMADAAKSLNEGVDRAAYTSHQFSASRLTPKEQKLLDQQMSTEASVTKSGAEMAKVYREQGERNRQMVREQQADDNLKWYQDILPNASSTRKMVDAMNSMGMAFRGF